MTEEEVLALPYRPCVGVMLFNSDGLVFAGQRIDNPGPAWQMPQGGIDKGEEPEEAALRELGEETGLAPAAVEIVARTPEWLTYDLPHDLVPKIWKGRFRGQKQLWYLMRFLGSDADINIETKHPEFSRWCWMSPDDLVAHIVPFKRALYAQVIESLKDRID
ncbi:RNA pyrophosphohydrolase [Amaricoccus macauensis]|uniref:RNA pyrophosphohydrolase n=1 Tax=Amaricoccus macauensis TaxID=57001 RepID=UPI003C7E891A